MKPTLASLSFVAGQVAGILLLPPATMAFQTLITFDVDGTLVSSSAGWEQGAHGRSFGHAVAKVLGNNDGDDGMKMTTTIPPIPDVLEGHEYHGSTDGLILMRLARKALGVDATDSSLRLNDMMDEMFRFVDSMDDAEVAMGIQPLPGVIDTLCKLAGMKDEVCCGLVTGNVEGIARRKMRAVQIYETGALSPPSEEQRGSGDVRWRGTEDFGFLGGFGSDYCSGDIDDASRNYLDRGEQIAIAVRRCLELKKLHPVEEGRSPSPLTRVVHVGDAPSDVLAAKAYAESDDRPDGVCVAVVGVATGSFSADELRSLAGESRPGVWEPIILELGIADPAFLEACGVV